MKPGDLIAGRFELVRFVARGGMGDVWRARDRHTGEDVAVKLITLPVRKMAHRLTAEARALLDLDHPAIVRYVAHESDPHRGLYLAMEWLDGTTLAERMKAQPLTIDEVLVMAARVGDGLGAAHERGMVHRDIKPLNLFLVGGRVDQVKILDFGIVRLSELQQITATGVGLGTPEYMAPEQARGERSIGPGADVFALGCVMYKCLTGRSPFRGRRIEAVLAKIAMVDQVPRVSELRPDIPPPVDRLIGKMMAYSADERPADGKAAAAAIRATREALAVGIEPTAQVSTVTPRRALTRVELEPVTVIFADLAIADADTVPSEALTSALPPPTTTGGDPTVESSFERLRVVRGSADAARALPAIRRAVEPYGARAEMLLSGSSVVMLSGGAAAKDLAARAAGAALAIRSILPEAAIGVASGSAVAGDRSALGPIIEEAAGLVRRGSREIRIDRATRDRLPSRFQTAGDGVDLAGFELVRERIAQRQPSIPPRPIHGQLLGKPTGCHGRNRLLRQLAAAFAGCVDDAAAEAVVVVGAAGIGKSRVRAELVGQLTDAHDPLTVIAAWGDPLRSQAPFGLLAGAVRDHAAIPDGDHAVQRNQLREMVRARVEPGEVERVTEFLGELAGIPFPGETSPRLRAARTDPELMASQIRRAFEDWMLAELARAPVLFLIDDLQWADEPSISLVASLLDRSANLPLMVFALGRPELQERFPNLGDDWNRQEIVLDALRPIDCEKIVVEALGDSVDSTTHDRIVTRSAGNPFYLEELIRAAAAGDLDRLPSSIIASVQLRIGRLDPAARQVLRAASIYGRRFTGPGISALLDEDVTTDDTADWLSILGREELIEPAGDGTFNFRHDLTREAAYQSLTEDDRRTGHHLAGDFLRSAGETDPVVLAEHFAGGGAFDQAVEWFEKAAEEAMSAGPGDANAVTALKTAATYFAKAGEAAARSYANQEATRFYERAVAIFSTLDPEDAASTRIELADVRERLGQRERALKELAETLEWLSDDHPVARAQVLLRRSALQIRADDVDAIKQSRREARAARDVGARIGRRDIEAAALTALAASFVLEDSDESSRRAIQYAERALALSQETENVGHAIWRLGNAFILKNDLDRATSAYEEALSLAERSGDLLLTAGCFANLGMVAFRKWEIGRAISHTDQAFQLYQRIGHGPRTTEMLLNLGTFHHFGGDLERARQLLQEALARGRKDWLINSLCRETLADIARHNGDEATAQKHLRKAVETCGRVGAREKESFYLGLLAESLWAAGDLEGAISCLERSIEIGGATLSYALLALRLGQNELARELLTSFKDTDPDPDRRALALVALARLSIRTGHQADARALCLAAEQLVPAEAGRFSALIAVVGACADSSVDAALAALAVARKKCGQDLYPELVIDVGELLKRSSSARPQQLIRYCELADGSGDQSNRFRIAFLTALAAMAANREKEAARLLVQAKEDVEDFCNALPAEYRDVLEGLEWISEIRSLRAL